MKLERSPITTKPIWVFWAGLTQTGLLKNKALPGGLGNRGKKGHLFQGNKGQIFKGSTGTKTMFGNGEHEKTNFQFLGNSPENKSIISGEKGNRFPPWEGLYNGSQLEA